MKTSTDPPTPKFWIERNAPDNLQNKSEWFIDGYSYWCHVNHKTHEASYKKRLSNEELTRRSIFWSICFGRRQKSEFIFCHVATRRVLSQWLEFLCLENPIPKQTHCRQFWKSLVWKTTGRWLPYDILWPTHFGVMAFLNWTPRKYAMEISPRWVWWKMHAPYCENR